MNRMKLISFIGAVLIAATAGLYLSFRTTGANDGAKPVREFDFRLHAEQPSTQTTNAFAESGRQTPTALELASEAASRSASSDAVVIVNGVPITAGELEEELGKVLISPAVHGGMNARKKEDLRKIALEELVVRELAYQRAKAIGLRADKIELAAAVRRIKQRYRTENAFRAALKADEITQKEFEQRIERDLLLKRIHQIEIEDKALVSDVEARTYYETNKDKFVLPESVHLHGILVKNGPNNEADARKKIDEAHDLIRGGKDFSEIAYKFSEDDYRVMAGDYGLVHRGQLETQIEDAAFAASSGEITGPFKSSFGWHLIKVDDKQPQRQLKFEEVEEKIKKSLYDKRRSESRLVFINTLKATALIQYPNR